jgi:2-octaprenyl-6-methoxyphenol hydroxylase
MKTDITIVGAGLVGMTSACALAALGLDIAVLDSANPDEMRKKESDGRTCAIAAGSAGFFRKIGVWNDMLPNAGEILDIRVTDCNSTIFLHYDHKLIGDEPMGYIIENYHLRDALFKRAKEFSGNNKGKITMLAPAKYSQIEFGEDGCVVHLADNEIIESQLIIAADGKYSNIRKLAGISTHDWQYNQSGIVCTIAHENHHQNIAQERFLPEGPFAVLPMQGGYHSSLVWTEQTHLVPIYLAMNNAEVEEQIIMRAGEYLGKVKLASRMYSYPLSLCKAKNYIGRRLALIGDAAHAMHPLAGQGFNLGIRDVVELEALLARYIGVGSDLGNRDMLLQYQAARMADSISLIGITDILNRAFSNNILPLKAARRVGMAAVNQILPLKKFFMKHAMGIE